MHPLRPATYRRAAAAATLTACTLLAACGTPTPVPKSRAANFADAPGVSNGEIRVGEVVDLTPAAAAVSRAVADGQDAFWKHVNEDLGGIAGYRITPVVKDAGPDAASAAARTADLAKDTTLLSQVPQATALALRDKLTADQIVHLPVSLLSAAAAAPTAMLTATPLRATGAAAVDWILKDNANAKLGLLAPDDDSGRDVKAGVDAAAKAARLEPTELQIKPNVDPAQLAAAFNKANVTHIVYQGPAAFLAQFAAATKSLAQRPTIVATQDSYSAKLLATPAKDDLAATAKVIGPYAPWGEEVPGMRPMLDATARFKPAYLQSQDPAFMLGWVQAELAFDVLRKAAEAGELSHAGLTAARTTLGAVDTGGLTPPLTFGPADTPVNRIPTREVRVFDVTADDPNAPAGLRPVTGYFAADAAVAAG